MELAPIPFALTTLRAWASDSAFFSARQQTLLHEGRKTEIPVAIILEDGLRRWSKRG